MFKKIIAIHVLFAALHLASAHAAPRQCNPEKSKPCGMSCIRKEFTCHKPTPKDGTAATVAPSAPKTSR